MIEHLLGDIAAVRREASEKPVAFDPVSLLVRRELDLSRVLAWMLDPDGTHGAGTTFLDLFLQMIDLPSEDNARVRVLPEYVLGPDGSRADILIRHPRWTVVVENKPWAKFGNRQIERYVSAIAARHGLSRVVILFGVGWKPDVVARLSAKRGVSCFMLGDAVRDWVARCAAATDVPDVCAFLNHIERYLDLEFGMGDARNMQSEINQMMRSPEAIAAAITVIDAEAGLAEAMNTRFAKIVADKARAHGLAIRPNGDAPLFGSEFCGKLRIGIDHPDYDYTIEAGQPMFDDLALGVCARKQPRGMGGRHGRIVALLEQALGQNEPAELWWPWWMPADARDPSGRPSRSRAALWAWAADDSDEGLAALFVTQAVAARDALRNVTMIAEQEGVPAV